MHMNRWLCSTLGSDGKRPAAEVLAHRFMDEDDSTYAPLAAMALRNLAFKGAVQPCVRCAARTAMTSN